MLDQELQEQAEKLYPYQIGESKSITNGKRKAFIQGAQWMQERDKLSTERINKYARHQFNRSALGLTLISFEEWSELPKD